MSPPNRYTALTPPCWGKGNCTAVRQQVEALTGVMKREPKRGA